MLTYQNNSDTAVIVLHEIYGINRHITKVCQKYSTDGYDVFCPDLLNRGTCFAYSQQEEAYAYFMKNVGFDTAYQINEVIQHIKPDYKRIFLIGFSVGAATAWRCTSSGLCDGMIGYYGSRIRDYLDISPKCPSLLLFANREKSFSVADLAKQLQKKENTTVHILDGNHGFCDPYSGSFNEQSAKEADKLTERFLSDLD